MNITKLFTTVDPYDNRDTVYRVEKEDGTIIFVHESVYDGPLDEVGGPVFRQFEVLKPEQAEGSFELTSFLDAVKEGKEDQHIFSRHQQEMRRRDEGRGWHEEGPLEGPSPMETPDGCVLVVMERSSHSDGHPYDWRYVAVPQGGVIRHPNGEEQKVEKPTKISFLDCNADYTYELPSGSSRYVEGVWQPAQKVEYDY